uniref:Frizzled/Smoothened 7TM domain-containing protein n=1 Tax=Trichobilharzia regenti TaxID=157069 RepID=A0AA85JAF0_TRIRE|nr:unnamed protein product [Trichobilharzia regenti]
MSTTHCVPIASQYNRTCLGNHLPYKLTTPIPLDDDVIFYDLEFWTALQSIPSCWDKLQFFLCSVYVPECVVSVHQTTKAYDNRHLSNIEADKKNSPELVNQSSIDRKFNEILGTNTTSSSPSSSSSASSSSSPSPSSSSSSSSLTSYRVVLPEAEMCEAVHKACPLLFSIIQSMDTSGNHHHHNNKRGINNIDFAGDDSSSSSNNRRWRSSSDKTNDNNNNNNDGRVGHSLDNKRSYSYPKFFDCSLYTPGCRQNKLTARLFQSNGGGCQSPLVTTSLRRNWIPGIERCSFPCRRPYFDPEHYKLARWITGCAAIVCLCTNILTLFTLRLQLAERMEITLQLSGYIHRLIDSLHLPTFSTDKKSHLIYHRKPAPAPPPPTTTTLSSIAASPVYISPSTVSSNNKSSSSRHNPSWCLIHTSLFYIHLFLLFGCFGWLLPLLPDFGEYVACREDGSLRVGEPQISSGKSILCIIDFILLYFSSIAAAIWSNIFDYALLYQMKKINYNLTNQQNPSPLYHQSHHTRQHPRHQQHGRQHRDHRHHHLNQRQNQTDVIEMKHIQSYLTKFSENLSKKKKKAVNNKLTNTDDNYSSLLLIKKRISHEPLSEITNSINLTNEKSSEFELSTEGHNMIDLNNDNIETIEPLNTSVINDNSNNNNDGDEKKYNKTATTTTTSKRPRRRRQLVLHSSCSFNSSFNSPSSLMTSSSGTSSSTPPSPSPSSPSPSLLSNLKGNEHLQTSFIKSNVLKESMKKSNNTTITTTITTNDNKNNGESIISRDNDNNVDIDVNVSSKKYDNHNVRSSPSSNNHQTICSDSIIQRSPPPLLRNLASTVHDNNNSSDSYLYSSPTCFPHPKPLISQILWIQLFTTDKYLFIHNNMDSSHGSNNNNNTNSSSSSMKWCEMHNCYQMVIGGDDDDEVGGDGGYHQVNALVTTMRTTTPITKSPIPMPMCSCSSAYSKSLMLKHGVIISSPINQSISTQPQTTCLHLLALAVPLVLTLISLTAAEIDGNSLSGICSVGLINIWARVGLLLIPFTLSLGIKIFYFIQLIHQFTRLRHKFRVSSFRVDREIAQRLVRYSLFYGLFLLFLLSLWLFSICIHTYWYMNEPVWLESQRLLFLCRIRYRLLGLDEAAAGNVCINTASSLPNINDSHILNSPNNPQSLSPASSTSSSPFSDPQHSKYQVMKQLNQPAEDSEVVITSMYNSHLNYLPIEETLIHKPSVGPILLHLFIYFAINLLYNSMCLLDPSVKRSWWYTVKRIIFWCQPKKAKKNKRKFPLSNLEGFHSHMHHHNRHHRRHDLDIDPIDNDYADDADDDDPNVVDHDYKAKIIDYHDKTSKIPPTGGGEGGVGDIAFNENDRMVKSYLNHITIGFSWWDPGFFIIPTPILSNYDLWIKCRRQFYWNKNSQQKEEKKKRSKQGKENILMSSSLRGTTSTVAATLPLQDPESVKCKVNPTCTISNENAGTTTNNNNNSSSMFDNALIKNDHDIINFCLNHAIQNPDQLNQIMMDPFESLLLSTAAEAGANHQRNFFSNAGSGSLEDGSPFHQYYQQSQQQHHQQQQAATHSKLPTSINFETVLQILRQLNHQLMTTGDSQIGDDKAFNNIVGDPSNVTATSNATSNSSSLSSSNNINSSSNGNNTQKNQNLSGNHNLMNILSHDPNLMASLTAAAAYEHYQKQLSELTTSISRRRSRHKRLLSSRTSLRRHSQSRSFSTNGLFLPGLTSSSLAAAAAASTMNLKVKGTSSSSTCSTTASKTVVYPPVPPIATTTTPAPSGGGGSSYNILQAAASMILAAAVASSSNGTNTNNFATNSNDNFNNNSHTNKRRLSQSGFSGIDAFSTHQLVDSSSSTNSAFGGSQISSASFRSALTSAGIPHHHHRRRDTSHTRPSSTSEAALITNNCSTLNELNQNSGCVEDSTVKSINSNNNNNNINNMHNMGSRMSSLHSISCASSSGAESYNSYRLLINQAGASWRELWRTRMLLMHVLRWAENVAPYMQTNNSGPMNNANNECNNEYKQSSQTNLSNYDAPQEQNGGNTMNYVKTTASTDNNSISVGDCTSTTVNNVPSISSSMNHPQQPSTFTPKTLDAGNDFNAQLVQLIMSLIEQQQHQQQLQSQSSVTSPNIPSVNPLMQASNNGVVETTGNIAAFGSGNNNPFIEPAHQLTSMDPMMAAAFAAATAAATVALKQQQQQQQQRQSSFSNLASSPTVNSSGSSGGNTTTTTTTITTTPPTTVITMTPNNCAQRNQSFSSGTTPYHQYPYLANSPVGQPSPYGVMPQNMMHQVPGQYNLTSINPLCFPSSPNDQKHNSPSCHQNTNSLHRIFPPRDSSLPPQYLNVTHSPPTHLDASHQASPEQHLYNTPNQRSVVIRRQTKDNNNYQCTVAPDLLIDHNQTANHIRVGVNCLPQYSLTTTRSPLIPGQQQQVPHFLHPTSTVPIVMTSMTMSSAVIHPNASNSAAQSMLFPVPSTSNPRQHTCSISPNAAVS